MHPAAGYARLADLMAECSEYTIFKKFAGLSVENLLLLQAEMVDLQMKLKRIQKEDKESGDRERILYGRDWYALKQSASQDAPEGSDSQQWKTLLEIRSKLDQYQKALLQHHSISKLQQPSRSSVKSLVTWMDRTDMGDVRLTGDDQTIWSHPDLIDLACLQDLETDDMLSRLLLDHVVHFYHKIIGRPVQACVSKLLGRRSSTDEKPEHLRGSVVYQRDTITNIVKAVATFIACMLPLLGILILYLVHDMSKRLGIIAGLTALFTICIISITSASTKDIFSATAAFSAVLVVFVGTNDNGN